MTSDVSSAVNVEYLNFGTQNLRPSNDGLFSSGHLAMNFVAVASGFIAGSDPVDVIMRNPY